MPASSRCASAILPAASPRSIPAGGFDGLGDARRAACRPQRGPAHRDRLHPGALRRPVSARAHRRPALRGSGTGRCPPARCRAGAAAAGSAARRGAPGHGAELHQAGPGAVDARRPHRRGGGDRPIEPAGSPATLPGDRGAGNHRERARPARRVPLPPVRGHPGCGGDDRAALIAAGHDIHVILANAAGAFFNQVFRDGFFHADLHPGNLFIEAKGAIVVVDFGIMGRLDRKTRYYLADMLLAFLQGDYRRVAEVHFEAGYVPARQSLDTFAQACRSIGEPILGRPLHEISLGRLLAQLFQVTEQFQMETQPQLLLLQKTMVLAEGVGRLLDPSVNMWALARPHIEAWMRENRGPEARLRDAAADVMSVLERLPALMNDIQRLGGAITEGGGLPLHPDTVAEIARRGAIERVVMTEGAQHFVTPLAAASLSAERVYTDLFSLTEESEMGHLRLAGEADLVVVAPATADLLAKMAAGLADDLASTALLATDKPILVAPAMNFRMWEHAATRANLALLEKRGVRRVGPAAGALAEGEIGMGRMAEPPEIVAAVEQLLGAGGILKGRRALVTSGPTHEAIDPVRYIANRSSGSI